MATRDTTSSHRRGRAMILTAVVTAGLALSGVVSAAMPATGSATATATVVVPAELEQLLLEETGDRIHQSQSVISEEDDCSFASFRCTR